MKIIRIIKGWGYFLGLVKPNEALEALSSLRYSLCEGCPFAVPSKFMKFIDGMVESEEELVCNKCSCPCKPKTLVIEESCPLNKW